jgi:hypothetical protein
MKTDVRSQAHQRTRINRWLDALRIQAEKLEQLALKTAVCADADVVMDQEPSATVGAGATAQRPQRCLTNR